MVQGSGIDAPLNATGQKQANQFFDYYKDYPFEKVYTSALQRTNQSVAQFLEKGIPHVIFEGLNEINWGEQEGKPFDKETHDHYLHIIKRWQQGELHVMIEGGESPVDVVNRQEIVIKHLIEEEEAENILICMHGRAMRILLCRLLNYPLSNMDIFDHHNLGLYQLTFTGSMFKLDKYNDLTHLNK